MNVTCKLLQRLVSGEMYRVILVEDEAVVREGIVRKIDWQSHGFELTGVYENGRQALEALQEQPVDAVITDINMPVMDGLTLSGELRKLFPDVMIVLLTGFDDFTYAQTAIRHRVHSYILKPVTARQLRELLDGMCADLRRREHQADSRWELAEAREVIREQFLRRLLSGPVSREEFLRKRDELALRLPVAPCCPAILSVPAMPEELESAMAFLHPIIQAHLGEYDAECLPERDHFVLLLSDGLHPEDTLGRILHHISGCSSFPVTGVIGPVVSSPTTLSESFPHVRQASEHLYRLPSGSVALSADLLQLTEERPDFNDIRRRIIGDVRLLNPDSAAQHLEELIRLLGTSTLNGRECMEELQKLLFFLSEHAGQEGWSMDSEQLSPPMEELRSLPSLALAHECVSRYLLELIHLGSRRNNSSERQAAQAVEYLRVNFADPTLSLQKVTTHLSVSTSHFSNLFKSHTGVTFVEYLTRLRIEKAQELLASTDYKNYQIAELVGYDDPGYFSSTFKKATGKKPSEYRKLHRN